MFAEHMQERERKDREARKAERRRRMDAFRALLEATASIKVRLWQHICLSCQPTQELLCTCALHFVTCPSPGGGFFYLRWRFPARAACIDRCRLQRAARPLLPQQPGSLVHAATPEPLLVTSSWRKAAS